MSNDDCLGKTEVGDYLSFVWVDIDRNMGFVCKDRIELFQNCVDKEFTGCFYSRARTQSEIILIYKCLNQTSWCQKTVDKAKKMQGRGCPVYAALQRSKDNLFIKTSLHGVYKRTIYTMM